MSQDAPVEPEAARTDPPDAVEWGGTAMPRGRVGRLLAGLWHDRRLVPIFAGLGALAVLGSMLSEWRVWTLNNPENQPGFPNHLSVTLLSFPTVGTAYLLGVLVVVACLTLAMFGGGTVRPNARLVGLAATGVLAGVLVATTVNLEQVGGVIDDLFLGGPGPDQLQATMTYGRGLYLAYAGVVLLGLALWLAVPAGQRRSWRQPEAQPARTTGDGGPVDADDDLGPDWPWQQRTRPVRTDVRVPAPLELTVESTTPFISPQDNRDIRDDR